VSPWARQIGGKSYSRRAHRAQHHGPKTETFGKCFGKAGRPEKAVLGPILMVFGDENAQNWTKNQENRSF